MWAILEPYNVSTFTSPKSVISQIILFTEWTDRRAFMYYAEAINWRLWMAEPLQCRYTYACKCRGLANCLISDFRLRYLSLLGYGFCSFSPSLAVRLLKKLPGGTEERLSHDSLQRTFSKCDLDRLEQYTTRVADRLLITDLLPASQLYIIYMLLSPSKMCCITGCG